MDTRLNILKAEHIRYRPGAANHLLAVAKQDAAALPCVSDSPHEYERARTHPDHIIGQAGRSKNAATLVTMCSTSSPERCA